MTEMMRQALVLAGCDMSQFDESNPRYGEELLMNSAAFLEQTLSRKYPGVEFEMKYCVRRGLNQPYDMYTLALRDAPETTFIARVSGNDGAFSCVEGYYGILRQADYEQLLRDGIRAAEPEAVVFSTIDSLFSDRCDFKTPIEEGMKETSFIVYNWILLNEDERPFETRMQALEAAVAEQGFGGDYTVYLFAGNMADFSDRATAFQRIPAHTADSPVYIRSYRFIH